MQSMPGDFPGSFAASTGRVAITARPFPDVGTHWPEASVMKIRESLLAWIVLAGGVRADIYQWEYINPGDPSQGKQQSATLCPGGAGVNAVPGANLQSRNLTMAYLIGADLSAANAAS